MKKKCATKKCRKRAARGSKCWSCIKRDYAKRHPLRYAYNNLKQNAKRRGKAFDLSFEEFEHFAIETEYYKKKGRKATCYHIDRIDPNKGYSVDNIQVLTNRENVKKYAVFKAEWNGEEMEFDTRVVIEVENFEEVPF